MTAPLQQILAELKSALVKLYGERLERVVLYGSQARGDAQPDSDIDILVILSGEFNSTIEQDRVSYITSDLDLKHDVLITTLILSEDHLERHKDWSFFASVRREGIQL